MSRKLAAVPFEELVDRIAAVLAATAAFLRFADDGGPGFRCLKYVSRETEVIAWPPTRPGRLLADIFDGL